MARTDGHHAVDAHVGARIRLRRKLLDLSQSSLADQLGITFQQVQKYERGANRVSASVLYETACALSVPIGFFFEGLPAPVDRGKAASDVSAEAAISAFLITSEGIDLTQSFLKIPTATVRSRLLELARALARDEP